jgi:hypothetical protein
LICLFPDSLPAPPPEFSVALDRSGNCDAK